MAGPGVTVTANLEKILAGVEADGFKVQVTLCDYGQFIPLVVGAGILANAGIPQVVIQDGSAPVSLNLYNNTVISPSGTFYCVAILTDEDDVIQAGNYQFPADGTFDLSNIQPIVPGTPTLISESPQFVTPTRFRLSTTVIGGALIGLYFNGSFQRPGIDYNLNLPFVIPTFPVLNPDNLFATYLGVGQGGLLVKPGLVVDSLTPMGALTFTLSKTPTGGALMGLYYNGVFERPGPPPLDYTLAGQVVTPNFATYDGDNLYAVYMGS